MSSRNTGGELEGKVWERCHLTYSVVTVWIWVCVLDPEILILPTAPEPFYFIVVIGICIGIKPTMKNRRLERETWLCHHTETLHSPGQLLVTAYRQEEMLCGLWLQKVVCFLHTPHRNHLLKMKLIRGKHHIFSIAQDTTDPVQPSNQRSNKYRIASYSYFRRVQM